MVCGNKSHARDVRVGVRVVDVQRRVGMNVLLLLVAQVVPVAAYATTSGPAGPGLAAPRLVLGLPWLWMVEVVA